MSCNMGNMDKVIRIFLGTGILFLGFFTETLIGAFGMLLYLSVIFSNCPLYSIIGMNTGCKQEPSHH